jgi:hypothetical protein
MGLEHEYRILRADRPLNFSSLIHELSVSGRRLDPGDGNAYRCPSGLALTSDDEEAEIASPPIPLRAGFTRRVDAWSRAGLSTLNDLLPQGIETEGYSTHLSISVPDGLADDTCDLYARTFAPALMLLLDGPASSGIYLRPRPGRLEACGEYLHGAQLRATAAFFAGSTRACTTALRRAEPRLVPPRLDVSIRPAWGRHGFYLGRRSAFGSDLYANPRRTLLRDIEGRNISAQQHLDIAVEAAATGLVDSSDDRDFRELRAIVNGSQPLRVEADLPIEADDFPPVERTIFGKILDGWVRPTFSIEAVAATWAFTIFRITGKTRDAYACVPAGQLETFATRVSTGKLDEMIHAYLRLPAEARRLSLEEQTRTPGLWDEASSSPALMSEERMPNIRGGAGKSYRTPAGADLTSADTARSLKSSRPGKGVFIPIGSEDPMDLTGATLPPPGDRPPPEAGPATPGRPPRRRIRVLLAGLLGVIAILIGAAAWALTASEGSAPTTTSSSPGSVVPTSTVTESPKPTDSVDPSDTPHVAGGSVTPPTAAPALGDVPTEHPPTTAGAPPPTGDAPPPTGDAPPPTGDAPPPTGDAPPPPAP